MLLIKYENDVVPHSSVCPASGMTVGDVTSNVIEPMIFDEENEHDEWKNAMEEEYESIMKNNTWE
jgi:hypothetical protein